MYINSARSWDDLSGFRALVAIVKVGFLNRVRRYRFLVTLVFCILACYVFVPAVDANYVTLGWGSSSTFYRGVYNSAWIGSQVALLTSVLLMLFGFYVVNDTVRMDEDSGVGQIIATAPLGNQVYTLGCAISNFVVLACMVFIVFLATLGMQFVRGEVFSVDIWAILSPFIVIVLPLMFLVSSVAVFFETFLRSNRGVGNILYVFLWLFGIPLLSSGFDLIGNNMIVSSMREAGAMVFPDLVQNSFILGFSWGFPEGRVLSTFVWSGVQWGLGFLRSRLVIVGVSVCVSLVASLRFNRFDPSAESEGEAVSSLDGLEAQASYVSPVVPVGDVVLRSLGGGMGDFGLVSMFLAEAGLMMKEFPSVGGLGLLGGIGLFIAGVILPVEVARGLLLPLAWILPVLYWGKLGTREVRFGTGQLVFSSARVFVRQYLALWLVGLLISLLCGGGVILRLMLNGEIFRAEVVFVGALFVPCLALCLGVWSGSSKVFEFLYPLLWYVGPMSGFVPLDFIGVLPGSLGAGVWRYYLGLSIILFVLGLVGRRLQFQR